MTYYHDDIYYNRSHCACLAFDCLGSLSRNTKPPTTVLFDEKPTVNKTTPLPPAACSPRKELSLRAKSESRQLVALTGEVDMLNTVYGEIYEDVNV